MIIKCRTVCLLHHPLSMLQVAVELGAPVEESGQLVEMVAGVGGKPTGTGGATAAANTAQWQGVDFDGLAPLFSQLELQQLLEVERGTALLAMRNEEQRPAGSW